MGYEVENYEESEALWEDSKTLTLTREKQAHIRLYSESLVTNFGS